ncbi:hypothetical protein ILYODFUR_029081 [Ilyodon furcidens]|uniref:Uncharacterized protein n=1 Tax=Ilyodon furcidens TaxID=33524 RepID=A0ABV0VL31_9TELE
MTSLIQFDLLFNLPRKLGLAMMRGDEHTNKNKKNPNRDMGEKEGHHLFFILEVRYAFKTKLSLPSAHAHQIKRQSYWSADGECCLFFPSTDLQEAACVRTSHREDTIVNDRAARSSRSAPSLLVEVVQEKKNTANYG